MKKAWRIIFFLIIAICCKTGYASVIEEISFLNYGRNIVVKMDSYTVSRVYQSDRYELLIILKDSDLSPDVSIDGTQGSIISKIFFEHFPDSKSVLTVKLKKEIFSIRNKWDYRNNRLLIYIRTNKKFYSDKSPVYKTKIKLQKKFKASAKEKLKADKKFASSSGNKKNRDLISANQKDKNLESREEIKDATGEYSFLWKERSGCGKIQNGEDSLLDILKDSDCMQFFSFKVDLRLAEECRFTEALESLKNADPQDFDKKCNDSFRFLKAYLKYKILKETKNISSYLDFKDEIELLINTCREPNLLPYGYFMAGMINLELSNYPYAIGFFNIIEKKYKDYKGMGAVLFNLGKLYFESGEIRLADIYLDKFLKKYPDTSYSEEARIIQGEIFYSKKRYFHTIKNLGPMASGYKKILYENPEVLQVVADSYFRTGNNKKARALFSRMYNLFPEIKGKDLILTSIGETFEEEGMKEKAEKIYRLVTLKYPGTEGFMKSSLKLADNMKNNERREDIYKMIIRDFPDSAEARVSLARLATLYYDQKNFVESINNAKALLAENPRALRKEALAVMAKAVVGQVEELVKNKDYAAALRIVEKERFYIEDMKNYDVHFVSGQIYLKTHMYQDAKLRLETAYKLYGKGKKPFELLKNYALANKEAADYNKAVLFADEIIKEYGTGVKKAWAFELKGDVDSAIGNYVKAESEYRSSAKDYRNNIDKGNIYRKIGDLLERYKKTEKSGKAFGKGLDYYLLAGKTKFSNEIAYCARKLGESNLKQKKFKDSISAFNKVLDSGSKNYIREEIIFYIGESFAGIGNIEQALKEYKKVLLIEDGDEIWKKSAEQKIRDIELEKGLDSPQIKSRDVF
ncbi:MAG: hypothetical protein CSB21_03105 [Deltaproteobacteria bacterium]|nr:MAG: hypothetical protein CSB21_03105 [Deltaproteobacteria bacterium]